MFSMCSELTPRARIPDTRIPQLMQPCMRMALMILTMVMMMVAMMIMVLLMHLQGRDSGSALQEARLIFDGHDDDDDDDDDHDLDEDGVDFNTTIRRSESFFFHAL